jgi:alanine racemase
MDYLGNGKKIMKTHIDLSAENLIHNLKEFRKLTGDKKIMLVVKANAYGHGLKEIVSITRDLDFIDYYAVDSVEEALTVREVDTHKKILVIGWVDKDQLEPLILNGIELVVPSLDYLSLVREIAEGLKKNARVHLKVETGTARMGMRPKEAINLIQNSSVQPNGHLLLHHNIKITGIYSHFANIEDTTDHGFAQRQLDVFTQLLSQIGTKSDHLLKHFSCSASTLLFPKTHFDIVRIGISAYGFWPSKPTYVSYIEKKKPAITLKPVLSWHSKVAQVKSLEKGESIGYGLTYEVFHRSKIIVVPVGYYDGYDRKLSNAATILVNGIKAPVRGRVCMDMLMADVTHIDNIKPGDPVILIGNNGDEIVSADHLAELAGTINYEIIARINPLITRRVV